MNPASLLNEITPAIEAAISSGIPRGFVVINGDLINAVANPAEHPDSEILTDFNQNTSLRGFTATHWRHIENLIAKHLAQRGLL